MMTMIFDHHHGGATEKNGDPKAAASCLECASNSTFPFGLLMS
jgi:hypothetical protein